LKAGSEPPRRRKKRRTAGAERKKIKAEKGYGVERREGGKISPGKPPKRGRKDRTLLKKTPGKRLRDAPMDRRSEPKERRKVK
jgi:hypothetical protein